MAGGGVVVVVVTKVHQGHGDKPMGGSFARLWKDEMSLRLSGKRSAEVEEGKNQG